MRQTVEAAAVALVGSYELFMTIIRGAWQPDDRVSGAEHVPEAVSGTDPLRVQAAEVFAGDVAAGRLPSIRAIRAHIGTHSVTDVSVLRVIEGHIITLRPYNARYTDDHRLIFRKGMRDDHPCITRSGRLDARCRW